MKTARSATRGPGRLVSGAARGRLRRRGGPDAGTVPWTSRPGGNARARSSADFAASGEGLERDGMNVRLPVRVNARAATWLYEHIGRSDRACGRSLFAAPAVRA